MGRSRRIKTRIERRGISEWTTAVVGLLLLSALVVAQIRPAHAGDTTGTVELAFDLPSVAPSHSASGAPDDMSAVEPVSQTVLAMQRGSGAAFALPLLPAAQPQPGIVLWDEMKPPQSQTVSSPGGQSVNQINPVQIR